jgi:hypothetical protein
VSSHTLACRPPELTYLPFRPVRSAYMYRLSLEYSRILHHDEPDGNDYYFEPRLMVDEEY